MSIIDNAIGLFNPKKAFENQKYRKAMDIMSSGDYDISTATPNYDIGGDNTEDDDIQDLETARNTSRLKVKNNGFAEGLITCAVDHVVGTGIKAKSTIPRNILNIDEESLKNYEAILDAYWNSWVNSQYSDITGSNDFNMQQALAYRTSKVDGECFAILPILNRQINLRLLGTEHIEGDQDGFTNGIKLNPNKKPIAYSLESSVPGSPKTIISNSSEKINVLHIFKKKRIDVYRGFPFMTPIARDLDYIDNYMKAELKAAQIAAIMMGSIKTDATENVFDKTGDLSGMTSKNPANDETKRTFGENTITQLKPNEELNIHEQGRDNPNFDKIVETSLRKVSSCTRISVEVLLTIFTSSYSASRASMLLMDKFVQPERKQLNKQFNNPVRNQVLMYGYLKGEINIPNFEQYMNIFLNCEWIGDAMGSVDPVKDTKGEILALEANLTTHEKSTRKLGNGDFEANVSIKKKERDLLLANDLIIDEIKILENNQGVNNANNN